MEISPGTLNRTTLGRQLLLGRQPLELHDAVRRLVGLQAQAPASPYLALWNRLAGFDPAGLDVAFADYTIVKSNMVRMTLHAIHADDFKVFREALEPSLRASKLDGRFTAGGLTVKDGDALVPELLDFASEPRSAADCEAWLEQHLDTPVAPAWTGLRQYAPLLRAPTGGPWSFETRPSYIAAPSRPVLADRDIADAGLEVVVRRYLEAFGPATVADIGLFAMVQRSRAKKAVLALAGELEQFQGPDRQVLYDIPGAPYWPADTKAPPRLLGMWDNVLLAYTDRNRIIPAEYRKNVARMNGDVLPTLLVDGYVAGIWRPVDAGIEATAFRRLTDEDWEGLAAEARSLLSLLSDRDPAVYSRYGRWWKNQPAAEVRVLPPVNSIHHEVLRY